MKTETFKIFTSDKCICFSNDEQLAERLDTNEMLCNLHSLSKKQLTIIYKKLMIPDIRNLSKTKKLTNYIFIAKDVEHYFEQFKSHFKIIEAAGGLVKNEKDEYLFIFRNGKWDLPKGKREKGEVIKTCAKREVKEECGVKKLTEVKKLITTYHTYFLEEKPVLKPTHWFKMQCNDDSKLIPQLEEGITKVKWVRKDKLASILKNTYPSIQEVIKTIE